MVCNNISEEKLDTLQSSIEKFPLSAQFLLNPGFRFLANVTPYSNDAPYYLLPPCKKLDNSNDQFCRKCPKPPNFVTDFFLIQLCHLLYFINPQLHAVSEKGNELSKRYLKTD